MFVGPEAVVVVVYCLSVVVVVVVVSLSEVAVLFLPPTWSIQTNLIKKNKLTSVAGHATSGHSLVLGGQRKGLGGRPGQWHHLLEFGPKLALVEVDKVDL